MAQSQIKYGALISYATIFFNIVAGLLYTPWMIRQIGTADYGLYSLVTAVISYFLIDFGLGSVIGTYVAKYRAQQNFHKVNLIIGISYKAYIIITACITLGLFICYFFLADIFKELTDAEIIKFKTIYCIGGFFSICNFPFTPVNGILIAYERFIALKLADLIQRALCIILIICCLLSGYGLYALVLVNGAIGLSISLLKFIYIKFNIGININIKETDKTIFKEIASFSGWAFIIGIAQRFIINIVPSILGIVSGTTQITIFAIASTLEGYVWTLASGLNGLFIPRVSKEVAQNQPPCEITNLMIKVGRIQLYIIGLLISCIIIFGAMFIKLWIGPDFHNSYIIAVLIISPNIIILTEEIANTLLWVKNELKYRAILFICAGIISSSIGIILGSEYGAIGTGIGILIALISCHCLGLNIVYQKVLHLDILHFFRMCHLKIIPIMIIPGIIFFFVVRYINQMGWTKLIIIGISFLICEGLVLYKWAMNDYEKNIIKSLIHIKRRKHER